MAVVPGLCLSFHLGQSKGCSRTDYFRTDSVAILCIVFVCVCVCVCVHVCLYLLCPMDHAINES